MFAGNCKYLETLLLIFLKAQTMSFLHFLLLCIEPGQKEAVMHLKLNKSFIKCFSFCSICLCQPPINHSSDCQVPPNPHRQEKAKHPVKSSLNAQQIREQLDISELLQIFCKPPTTQPFVSHHLEQHH